MMAATKQRTTVSILNYCYVESKVDLAKQNDPDFPLFLISARRLQRWRGRLKLATIVGYQQGRSSNYAAPRKNGAETSASDKII